LLRQHILRTDCLNGRDDDGGPENGGVDEYEHPLNDYKGLVVSRVLHDFYELDPQKVSFYGGGGLDARFESTPISFALGGLHGRQSRLLSA